MKTNRCHTKDGHLRCQGQKTMKKTDIASFYKEMFDVGDDADDGGVDQAVDVEVAGHTKKAATKRRQKSVKKDSRGKKAATETKEKEAVLLAAPTAE